MQGAKDKLSMEAKPTGGESSGSVFIAPGAFVVGRAILGRDVSVWYNAVIRADNDLIDIGEGTNIQDGAILHTDAGFPLVIGQRNTVGHGAVLHGCTIGNENLIGIRATLLNGCRIGNGCLIGAHALITQNMEIPDGSLVLGAPAKIAGKVSARQYREILDGVEHYITRARQMLSDI